MKSEKEIRERLKHAEYRRAIAANDTTLFITDQEIAIYKWILEE